jgi:Flp pilus assembly protein TadD
VAELVAWGAGRLPGTAKNMPVNRMPVNRVAMAVVGATMLAPLSALCWRHAERYHDSLGLLRYNVQAYPTCWAARAMLGAELGIAGQYAQAIEELKAAQAMRPDAPDVPYNLGRALAGAGRDAEAIVALGRATEQGRFRARAHHDLGVIDSRQGLREAARHEFEQALALLPADLGAANSAAVADAADGRRDLGALLADMGRPEDALAELDKSLAIRPDDAEALNDRGSVCLDRGRLEAAVADLERAVALKPDFPAALANLGSARLAQGQAALARDLFGRALALAPANAGLHFNLGLALERLGDLAGARAQWQEALRLAPSLARARARLGATSQAPARGN